MTRPRNVATVAGLLPVFLLALGCDDSGTARTEGEGGMQASTLVQGSEAFKITVP